MKWMIRYTRPTGLRTRRYFDRKRDADAYRKAHGIKAAARRVDW